MNKLLEAMRKKGYKIWRLLTLGFGNCYDNCYDNCLKRPSSGAPRSWKKMLELNPVVSTME